MAEKNGLGIGDSLSLTREDGGKTELKIIGLFEVVKQAQAYINVNSFDKLENQIFTGIQACQDGLPHSLPGFQSVIFEVNDPAQLDDIISQDVYKRQSFLHTYPDSRKRNIKKIIP